MRLCILTIPVIALTACSPVNKQESVDIPVGAVANPPKALVQVEKKPAPEVPKGPVRPIQFTRTKLSGITIEAVTFDSRTHRMIVADQPNGPGSRWSHSKSAGTSYGGLAALNGGFFTPEGKPLGRVIAQGKSSGYNNQSSLGSGYYVDDGKGNLSIVRRDKFSGGQNALQAGPFLVERRQAIRGLSNQNSRDRSFIATDGKGGWVMARTSGCSLAQLGNALSGNSIGGISINTALNLDGGRSSDLWVSSQVSGGPVFTRPIWNKPVRNFLIIKRID